MRRELSLLGAAAVGAGLMYVFDPEKGKRRRGVIYSKLSHARRVTSEAIDTVSRDARNRVYGAVASIKSVFKQQPIRDDVLAEHVRAKLGFLVAHPGSIEVNVQQGRVILSGPILAEEVEQLLAAIQRMRGVTEIENRLEVHEKPDHVPGLQGEPPRPKRGEQPELLQVNWSPTTRAVAGVAGGVMAYYGLTRRSVTGTAFGLAGLTLLARAATNLQLRRLLGVGAGPRAVDVLKTVNIKAPIDQVYQFFSDYKKFPRIMRHIEEVHDVGEGRSRWTAAFPGGVRFHWTTVLTRSVPNKELQWQTEPDSLVQHAGTIKFAQNPDGSTAVHIRVSYNPPGGAIGHAVAALLGTDIKHVLDEELMRLKSVIETGVYPHDLEHRRVPDEGARRAEHAEASRQSA